jgi:hypothetical protein
MIISQFITCVDELAMFEMMAQAMRVGPGTSRQLRPPFETQ